MQIKAFLLTIIILVFSSCNSPTTVRLDKEKIPGNGVVITGTEGVNFGGSIKYHFKDGSHSIASLATLSVPDLIDFDHEILRAEIEIFKRKGEGEVIVSLYKNGLKSAEVTTAEKGELLSLIYDITTSHQ